MFSAVINNTHVKEKKCKTVMELPFLIELLTYFFSMASNKLRTILLRFCAGLLHDSVPFIMFTLVPWKDFVLKSVLLKRFLAKTTVETQSAVTFCTSRRESCSVLGIGKLQLLLVWGKEKYVLHMVEHLIKVGSTKFYGRALNGVQTKSFNPTGVITGSKYPSCHLL